jgi:hypothetical protein
MSLFGSIRQFNDRSHVHSMRALRVLQPVMFFTAASFHACMLVAKVASPIHLALRCGLLSVCILGLVAALRAHEIVRRGATAIARIKGFLAVLALSIVAIANYLLIGWEILRLGES